MNYDKIIATAAQEMRASGIRKFFDIAAEMKDCISLGVGEPDFKTPWAVRDAGIRNLEMGQTRYTSNSGMKELRTEICKYLDRRFDLHYDPDSQVLVTVGGSEAIDIGIRALVNPGDEVIIPEPCYVCYDPITHLTGGKVVSIPLQEKNQFRLTAEELKAAITPRTKMLILPFPCNPTGAVMEKEDLEAIAEVLRGTDIMVLSDEIYAELTYGADRHVSIASLPGMAERTIVVNGQDPPELHHVCPHHQPDGRHYGHAGMRRRDRHDAGRIQPPPPASGEELQRHGAELLRPQGRVLCVPLHQVHRHDQRRVLQGTSV